MNAQLTFDTLHRSDPRAVIARARHTDPESSHLAAASLQAANGDLERAVRWYVSKKPAPVSAFAIADALCGPRWQHDTIRSAVSRSGLVEHKNACRTRGGRKCNGYSLGDA